MHARRSRIGGLLALVVAALALTACAPPGASAVTSPAPASSSPPAPSPSPAGTSAAPAPPPLASLVLTVDGLGPLRIGEVPTMNDPATDPVVWDEAACSTGTWVPNYGPHGTMLDQPFIVVTAAEADGTPTRRVGEVLVYADDGIATDRGIHVGSTRAELQAAYPEATHLPGDYTQVPRVVAGPAASLVFDFTDGTAQDSEDPADRIAAMGVTVSPHALIGIDICS